MVISYVKRFNSKICTHNSWRFGDSKIKRRNRELHKAQLRNISLKIKAYHGPLVLSEKAGLAKETSAKPSLLFAKKMETVFGSKS